MNRALQAALSRMPPAIHLLVTVGLGVALVITPLPLNIVAIITWAVILVGWLRKARGPGNGTAELVVHLVSMSVLVFAAACRPVQGRRPGDGPARHLASADDDNR